MSVDKYEFEDFNNKIAYTQLSETLWRDADRLMWHALSVNSDYAAYRDWQAIRRSLTWETQSTTSKID